RSGVGGPPRRRGDRKPGAPSRRRQRRGPVASADPPGGVRREPDGRPAPDRRDRRHLGMVAAPAGGAAPRRDELATVPCGARRRGRGAPVRLLLRTAAPLAFVVESPHACYCQQAWEGRATEGLEARGNPPVPLPAPAG